MESHLLEEVDILAIVVEVLRQMCPDAVRIGRLIQVILVVRAVWMRLDVLVHLHGLGIAWKLDMGMASVASNHVVACNGNLVQMSQLVELNMSLKYYFEAVDEITSNFH